MLKKLFAFSMLLLAGFSALAQYGQYDGGRYGHQQESRVFLEPPSICNFYARELVVAISEADRQGGPVERSERYQSLRGNPNFQMINTPAILRRVKDLQMNGASWQDLHSASSVLCNQSLRGGL